MITYKTVDEFMAHMSEDKKQQIQILREIIIQSHPKLIEHIKWNSPSFMLDDEDRITFSVRDGFPILIVLHMGAKTPENKNAAPILPEPSPLIEWKSDTRGVIPFTSLDDIENKRDEFIKILAQWLAI